MKFEKAVDECRRTVVLNEENFENAVKFAQTVGCSVDDFINETLSFVEFEVKTISFSPNKPKAGKIEMLYKRVKNILLRERISHK
ncbi:MAG: hypothetical protein WC139_07190 [Candidatus Kapaibacterium sp.]